MNDRLSRSGLNLVSSNGSGMTGPSAFYGLLIDRFRKEYEQTPARYDFSIRIENKAVKLAFTRPETRAYFTAAFKHIEHDPGGNFALTICCIAAGGEFMERAFSLLPGRYVSGKERDIPFLIQDGITIAPGREGRTISILNIPESRAVFLFTDLAELPYHEQGSPFRNILQWWFNGKESTMLHSGAVSLNGRALLISGKGGSGKSTMALSCLLDGMDYLGDDYVVVADKKDMAVSSLYDSLKLTEDSFRRFPAMREWLSNPDFSASEKGVIFLHHPAANRVVPTSSLRGIVIPEISRAADSSYGKISAAEGFRSLAPSTIFQHVGRRNELAAFTAGLVRALPCFKLTAGSNPVGISRTVRAILREI